MKLNIIGEKDHTVLDKLSITIFVGEPSAKKNRVYCEVCAKPNSEFHISSACTIEAVTDKIDFYSDKDSFGRLITAYASDDAGEVNTRDRHIQEVGKDTLHVTPRKAAIKQVASTQSKVSNQSWKFNFDQHQQCDSDYAGAWFVWNEINTKPFRRERAQFSIEIESINVTIRHLYFFIVQPKGYRVRDSSYLISQAETILGEGTKEILLEAEVPEDFPVFPEWEAIFIGKKYLKNRKGIHLKNANKVEINVESVSEELLSQMLVKSYYGGVILAISASVLVSCMFYFIANADTITEISAVSQIPEVFILVFILTILSISSILYFAYQGIKFINT